MPPASTIIAALKATLPDAACVWALWFALTWFWLWVSAVRNAARMALMLSSLLFFGGWASFTLQGASRAGEWTRWGSLVVYFVVLRLIVGGTGDLVERRRLRSIERRR